MCFFSSRFRCFRWRKERIRSENHRSSSKKFERGFEDIKGQIQASGAQNKYKMRFYEINKNKLRACSMEIIFRSEICNFSHPLFCVMRIPFNLMSLNYWLFSQSQKGKALSWEWKGRVSLDLWFFKAFDSEINYYFVKNSTILFQIMNSTTWNSSQTFSMEESKWCFPSLFLLHHMICKKKDCLFVIHSSKNSWEIHLIFPSFLSFWTELELFMKIIFFSHFFSFWQNLWRKSFVREFNENWKGFLNLRKGDFLIRVEGEMNSRGTRDLKKRWAEWLTKI